MPSASSLLFRAEKPHFFKVIFAHSLTQHKLLIPRKFSQSYGDDLSSHVMLKVPSGAKWRVEIAKSEGDIWLQNGWHEFAEYYSVVVGSFLVFEYEKSNCEFNVIIFDTTATEIDYPFILSNLDEHQVPQDPNVVSDGAGSDVSVEILPSQANLDEQFQNLDEEPENRRKLSKEEKAKAVERAMSNFRSANPTFRIVMQPSYVHTNGFEIPSSFSRKYLNKISGVAILNVLDGRSWSVKYYYSTCSGAFSVKNTDWTKFVHDNRLQVGDVCIFELLEYVHETVFRVSISKYSNSGDAKQSKLDKQSCSKQQKLSSVCPKRWRVGRTCNVRNANHTRKKMKKLQHFVRTSNRDCPKGNKIIKPRFSFNSANHTLQIEMQPSNFVDRNKYYLDVSLKFVNNMEQGSHKVKLQVDNKLWPVKLHVYPQRSMFCEGWIEFARKNSLKVGDVCTFEPIDKEMLLIRVSISMD